MAARDLLLELGTEELPARRLLGLGTALSSAFSAALSGASLSYASSHWYAAPRRLAVLVRSLSSSCPGVAKERRGPALSVAFDASGEATPAALGFARSCGVAVSALSRGESHLFYRVQEGDRATLSLLPDLLRAAVAGLPPGRCMRWNGSADVFIRPVRWLVLLYGSEVVDAELFGLRAGRCSFGHRLLSPASLELDTAGSYVEVLEQSGKVLVSPALRLERIRSSLSSAAASLDGCLLAPPGLLSEVSSMVEWPRVVAGSFPSRFLELPQELLVTVLAGRQRFFPLTDASGGLLPRFLAVMDQDPEDPERVCAGYERVLLPRFEDAAFFRLRDLRHPFVELRPRLAGITFHHRLGSMLDKSDRIAELCARLADVLGYDVSASRLAGELCKCDLLTELVGEFPELQGFAGSHYASAGGVATEVSLALVEQYLPRQASDSLPGSLLGKILALSDRLDSLSGIFGVGEAPGGDKDPYGLRRSALACMRILVEGEVDLDLEVVLQWAVSLHGLPSSVVPGLLDFMLERWRSRCLEEGVSAELFDAVRAVRPGRPLDLQRRLQALSSFQQRAEFRVLIGADKRIRNILRKSEDVPSGAAVPKLLRELEEQELARHCWSLRERIAPHLERGEYDVVLAGLSELQQPVEQFFREVLVQCKEDALRRNRLALLSELQGLLRSVADLSLLPGPSAP